MDDKIDELTWYEIVFKQMSPIHIGEKNYGVLSETKVFIPGWTLWGALVNSYGKYRGGETKDFEEGKKLFENITCFYPKIDGETMFPEFKDGRLYMGDISKKQFRISYTDVFMSTAIDPIYVSAKDASLHETEVILHKSKDKKKNIYWVGLIGVEKEHCLEFTRFINNLDEIFIGGEISYGFGRMKIVNSQLLTSKQDLEKWNLSNNGSLFIDDKNPEPIKNYICLSDDIESINGRLKFIVQYDFAKTNPSIDSKCYCFIPGSEIYFRKNRNDSFRLKKGMFVIEKA